MAQLVVSSDHLALDRFISVAGATLWVYDYLLTCPDEYARIWPSRWSLVKVLYMANRYVAVPYLGLAMSYMLGKPAERHAQTALYANRRWATWLLYSTFTLTHLLTAGFGAHSVVETYPTVAYLSFLRVCLSGIPTYIKLIYFFQIPFEFLLLAMQLAHYWKLSRAITPVRITPLLNALYTDGVLYFIATITVRLWAGLVVVFLDPTYWYMTVVIDLATTSTFISRIFLHLNEVSTRRNYGTTFDTMYTTGIVHAQRAPPRVGSEMEMESQKRTR